jgi:hypothetical protein
MSTYFHTERHNPERLGRAVSLGDTPATRLGATIRSESKMWERTRLLAEQPHLRRRIATASLRQIIDFVDFRCHPQCSVARDEAIAGSDIDCGLVITAEPTGTDEQLAFVGELRQQGFEAYHPVEFENVDTQYNQMVAAGVSYFDPSYQELFTAHMAREFGQIHFTSLSEAPALPPGPIRDTYLAGFSIQ